MGQTYNSVKDNIQSFPVRGLRKNTCIRFCWKFSNLLLVCSLSHPVKSQNILADLCGDRGRSEE